jgi:hypothetical protein
MHCPPPPLLLGATSRLSRLALCSGRFGWVLWTADGCRRVSGLSTLHTLQVCMFGVDGCSGYQASPITLPARHMVRREPASCRRRRRGPQVVDANHRRLCPPSPTITTFSQRDQPTPERAGTGEPPSPHHHRPLTPSHSPTPARGVPGCHAASARLPRPSTPAKSQLSSPGTTRDPPSAINNQQPPLAAHHSSPAPDDHSVPNLCSVNCPPALPREWSSTCTGAGWRGRQYTPPNPPSPPHHPINPIT